MGIVHKTITAADLQLDASQYISPENRTPVHMAAQLTQDGPTAHIRHLDQIYTLRITRAGKLILTK